MPRKTPSVRLPSNIHRAVKNSEYSIGDLARTGIEAAVISGFNSVCWICGAGIHNKERSQQIDRGQLREYITNDPSASWRGSNLPTDLKDHQRLQDHVAQTNDTTESDIYHQLAGDWLAVPDRPVDICTECLELLDRIKNRRVPLNELPVPYTFRVPKGSDPDAFLSTPQGPDPDTVNIEFSGARRNPVIAYTTDVTVVALADYTSFQRREDREEVFWWAGRDRDQTVKYGLDLWRETAIRSHAHRLGWGNQPRPVFELAVERTPLNQNRSQNQLAHQRPGLRRGEKKEIKKKIKDNGEFCPGCGDTLIDTTGTSLGYCRSCLFCGYYKSSHSDFCGEPFAPYVDGELRKENVMRRCCECGKLQDVEEEYVDVFMNQYRPVFESMQYAIPMDVPEKSR